MNPRAQIATPAAAIVAGSADDIDPATIPVRGGYLFGPVRRSLWGTIFKSDTSIRTCISDNLHDDKSCLICCVYHCSGSLNCRQKAIESTLPRSLKVRFPSRGSHDFRARGRFPP